MPNVHDCTVKPRKGATPDLPPIGSKLLRVANTATGCGFMPQCEALLSPKGGPA